MITTSAPAASPPQAAPHLDLDARMALRLAEMDERCTLAVLAVDVNSAHIPAAEPLPEITAPPHIVPAAAPCPYSTPLAAVLYRAQQRMERDGWTTRQLRDEQGQACCMGAIRAEASSRSQADDACAVLLEAIQRDFRDATTIPSWNDAQRNPRLPLIYLGRAADLANARNQ
ncbi:hypothetical protein ACFC08_17775 [Streptomyces sp. NPDC056112]|uniref:DUF6197 family protein n=1 Tax=Streptomyces sp. NPDC056112 TaxID=3345715 RepID=UPI0035DDA2CF